MRLFYSARFAFAVLAIGVFLLFRNYEGAITTAADAENGPVTLWRMTVSFEERVETPKKGGWTPGYTAWEPLTLQFAVTESLNVDDPSLNATYTYQFLADGSKEGSGWMGRDEGSGNAVFGLPLVNDGREVRATGRPEIVVGRHLRFDEPITDLNLTDAGLERHFRDIREQPSSFYVAVHLFAPMQRTVKFRKFPQGNRTAAGVAEFKGKFRFLYDVDQPTHEGEMTFESGNALAGARGQTPAISDKERGIIRITNGSRNRVHFKIDRSNKKIEYMPTLGTDLTGTGNNIKCASDSWRDASHPSPNLVLDSNGGSCIHANNGVIVQVEGKHRTSNFHTSRFLRTWKADVGDPVNGPGGYRPRSPWENDAQNNTASWDDTPGQVFGLTPSSWPSGVLLQEFVVGVLDLRGQPIPEFQFVYYTALYETQPSRYRIRMSRGETITVKEWAKIKASRQPFWDGAQNIVQDTGWCVLEHGSVRCD